MTRIYRVTHGTADYCVLHGLRKTAARIVAELGGKVGSVTGHLSPAMEAAYSRDADQAKMAKDVIVKWGKRK